MLKERFDWQGGKVVLWELGAMSAGVPLEAQLGNLQEDLVHVEFGATTVLDVTWQSEPAAEPRFIVQVVKNQHWEEPALRVECHDLAALERAISSAIDAATRARGRN
jgi:hypothetical protein